TIVSSSSGWVVHSAAQFYAGIVGLSYDGAPRPSGATVVSSVDWRPSQAALQDEQFRKIWEVATSCIGTKYVYGGNVGPGKDFDCSAFVTYVYRNSGFRNIYRMSTIGLIGGYTDITTNGYVTKIDYPEPGDLIFFKGTNPERPANYVSHVAIYLGEGMMIHASSSAKGVVVAPYEDSYLKTNHFLCYGRVRSDR
ncbi:MAG: C40 family peptidase, partial [Lachnospiraceae bacterium]|nr:C40 family peptidase [Lachnospiraceae bacterium]